MKVLAKRARLAVSLLLPAVVGCGGVEADEPQLGRQASAIQEGTSADPTHTFAVGIASEEGAVCSGTLIAPNLVLTARHCVVPSTDDDDGVVTCTDEVFEKSLSPSTLFVSTEPDLHGAKKFYAAKRITTPADTAYCGNDIALVQLVENIPSSEARPATPVVHFPMTDRARIGERVAAVGYGTTRPSAADSGLRRFREDIDVLCVPGDPRYDCDGPLARLLEGSKEFMTAGYVCSGDSGGGAFEQESFRKGTPYVLGALSRGPETDHECLAGVYTRTDAHADMIRAAAEIALAEGGYDRPDWLSPGDDLAAYEPVEGCVGNICTAVDATDPGSFEARQASSCSTSPLAPSSPCALSAFGAALALAACRRRRVR